jgi:ketosteroid isomerase-like protein
MTDGTAIEARLKHLQDLEDIKALRHTYAYCANIINGQSSDIKGFAALFAEDATFDVGVGVATGPAEIEQQMLDGAKQWWGAMHYMLNPLIRIEGDRATGQFTGLFALSSREGQEPMWLSNLYSDTYVRTPGGWKFQSVRVRTAFASPEFAATHAEHIVRVP